MSALTRLLESPEIDDLLTDWVSSPNFHVMSDLSTADIQLVERLKGLVANSLNARFDTEESEKEKTEGLDREIKTHE